MRLRIASATALLVALAACGENEPAPEPSAEIAPPAGQSIPSFAPEVIAPVANQTPPTAAPTPSARSSAPEPAEQPTVQDAPPPPPPEAPPAAAIWNGDAGAQTITWDDLLPPGEEEELTKLYNEFYANLDKMMLGQQMQLTAPGRVQNLDVIEGSSLDYMPQIGTFNTVASLNNAQIKLPGFIVPLDFRKDHTYTEFLLVPYFGACLHTPPPPPNQIVFVKTSTPVVVKDIWSPVWVEGLMKAQRHENDVGNAAYSLTLVKLSPYET